MRVSRSFSVLIGLLLALVIPSRARAQGHSVEGADYRVFTRPGDPAKFAEIAANVNINTVELAGRFGVSVFDIRKDNPTNTLALCHTARDRYVMSEHIRTADDRATNEVWNTCAEDRKAVYIIPGVTIKVTGTHYLTPSEEHGFVETFKACTDANCVQGQLDKLGSKAKVAALQEPAAKPKTPEPVAPVAAPPAPSPLVTAKPVATAKAAPTVAPSKAPDGSSPIVGILGLCAFGLVMVGAGNIAGRRSAKKKLLKQLELAKQLPPGPTLRNLTASRVVQEDNYRTKYVEAAQRLEHADAENVRLSRLVAHYESLKTSQVAISGSSVILQMAPTVPQPVLPGPDASVEAEIASIDSHLANNIGTMSAHDKAQAMGKLSFLTTQLQATKGRDEAIPALPVSTLRLAQDSDAHGERQTMPDGVERKGTLKGLGITPVAAVAQQSIINELEAKNAKLETQAATLKQANDALQSEKAGHETRLHELGETIRQLDGDLATANATLESAQAEQTSRTRSLEQERDALNAWKQKATDSIVAHAKARRALRRELTAKRRDLATTKKVMVDTVRLGALWKECSRMFATARDLAKQASAPPDDLDEETATECVQSVRADAAYNAREARQLRDQLFIKLAQVLDAEPHDVEQLLCSDFDLCLEPVIPANPAPVPTVSLEGPQPPQTLRGVAIESQAGDSSPPAIRSLKEFPLGEARQSDPFGNLVDSLFPEAVAGQIPPESLKAPLIPAEARRPTLPSYSDDEQTEVRPLPDLPKKKSAWSVTPAMGNPIAAPNGQNGIAKANGANGASHAAQDVPSEDEEVDRALDTLSKAGAYGRAFRLNRWRDQRWQRILNLSAVCDPEVLGQFAKDEQVHAEFCDERPRTLWALLSSLDTFPIPGRKPTMPPPPVFQHG
ncbi:MAG: hypothetical protein WA001_04675 [Patescibacteria group bacterium]